jgi:hypothetical protein
VRSRLIPVQATKAYGVVEVVFTDIGTGVIPRKIQRDIVVNVHMYSCKVPVILVRF